MIGSSTKTKTHRNVESIVERAAGVTILNDGIKYTKSYQFSNGRQLAIQNCNSTELNIWIEDSKAIPVDLMTYAERYAAHKTRIHSLKANAPNLYMPNPALKLKFKFDKLTQEDIAGLVEQLLEHYAGYDRTSVESSASGDLLIEDSSSDRDTSDLLAEVEFIESAFGSCPAQDIEAIVKRRLGQGKFRRLLMKKFGAQCCVTGISSQDFLVASHVKPWSECEDHEKVDPNNGLLLSTSWDRAFDKNYISFLDDGSVVISSKLTKKDRDILGIFDEAKIDVAALSEETKSYLALHRKKLLA